MSRSPALPHPDVYVSTETERRLDAREFVPSDRAIDSVARWLMSIDDTLQRAEVEGDEGDQDQVDGVQTA